MLYYSHRRRAGRINCRPLRLESGKSVLVIEKSTFGGQITWSPKVENFPGIPSVSGAELGDKFTAQALDQGAELELDEVTSVELDGDIKRVKTILAARLRQKRSSLPPAQDRAPSAFPARKNSWAPEFASARCATARFTRAGRSP